MVTSGSAAKRHHLEGSQSGQKEWPQTEPSAKPAAQQSAEQSTVPHGQVPLVVFASVAVSLWAITVMVIGQTLGRLVRLSFPLVAFAGVAVAIALLVLAIRRALRVVVTIGDVVSVISTGVLAFAARGLLDWPFLAPLTVADDAARHFGMVNWIAAHNGLPNNPTQDLLQFAEYPMSAHYLAATIARTFGVIPLRVANALVLGVTYGMWMLLGSAVAFGLRRTHRTVPHWQQALAAATVPLVGYALYTLTLWAVTASYFYAQVVGLWFACVVTAVVLTNPDQLLGESLARRLSRKGLPEPVPNDLIDASVVVAEVGSARQRSWSTNLPAWWPLLVALMLGPSLVYPLHVLLTAAIVSAVVLIERRKVSAALIAVIASVVGLAVQLPWLGAATKMSQEEGSILLPTLHDFGGIVVAILLLLGLAVTVRTRQHTIGALSLMLGAAQVGALALGYQFGAVSNYTSIKVISSLIPGFLVVAALGATNLAVKLQELLCHEPIGPNATSLSGQAKTSKAWRKFLAPALAALVSGLAFVHAVRFPPLTGLTRPLVSADGYRVARWASTHVDSSEVGVVAPGIEAYSLFWTALDRKKDLSLLRKMQPASKLWSNWPAEGAERYLIVVTEGQAKSYARRPNVNVVFRSGSAMLLERTK
jgi:hypothetical protein